MYEDEEEDDDFFAYFYTWQEPEPRSPTSISNLRSSSEDWELKARLDLVIIIFNF